MPEKETLFDQKNVSFRGRYWDRTSVLRNVKPALYHLANRPLYLGPLVGLEPT